jgi:hypothetical protein
MNINLAWTFYGALIRPVITFAANPHLRKLRVFQTKVPRIITKVPKGNVNGNSSRADWHGGSKKPCQEITEIIIF